MAIFYPFLEHPETKLIGLEAAGLGVESGQTAATLTAGTPGVLHGSLSFLLQTTSGQVELAHSISAGLDYPGVGPEHAHLSDKGLVDYFPVTDAEAMDALKLVSQLEGIIPAIETAHAFAHLEKLMPDTSENEIVVLNCSGRGDKDMGTISEYFEKQG